MTDEQILEQLRQTSQQQEQIPDSQRIPISNPDKYSFLIGLDDSGNFFTQPSG